MTIMTTILALSVLLVMATAANAFVTPYWRPSRPPRTPKSASTTRLQMVSTSPPHVQRVALGSVSVSPRGFFVLFNVPGGDLWPLQVTASGEDQNRATSPESLTLCQLIGGVDMAGAILPPDLLSKIAVIQSEAQFKTKVGGIDKAESKLHQLVQQKLPENITSYTDAHPWVRSRISLPQVTLDEVYLSTGDATSPPAVRLICRSREFDEPLKLELTDAIAEKVAFQYEPNGVSAAFLAVALSLRYKAPVHIAGSSSKDDSACADGVPLLSLRDMEKAFPMASSVSKLKQASSRVQETITRSFEANKLQGALRIAIEKGDRKAAEKIRQKLDEFDSLADLPTLEQDDLNQME